MSQFEEEVLKELSEIKRYLRAILMSDTKLTHEEWIALQRWAKEQDEEMRNNPPMMTTNAYSNETD